MVLKDEIRPARPFKFIVEEKEPAALDELLAEIDALRKYFDERGGPKAAEATYRERGAGNEIYIDFSHSISNDDRCAIISFLKEWWGIPVVRKECEVTGVWEEEWVLVLDEVDWADYEAYKESTGSKLTGDFIFGHHDGSWYPEERSRGTPKYRGYSFVNFEQCRNTGINATFMVPRSATLQVAREVRRDKYLFSFTEGFREEVKKKGFYELAVAKVTAWYICHELSHGIFKAGEAADIKTPFQAGVVGLEILYYYTYNGRKSLKQNTNLDLEGYYDYFGTEGWPKVEKPLKHQGPP
ncbi:MAG: hypothetical protein GTN49_05005 [candidate division Zixibacteria bacterium]|nr:hypothetical protein [candidate division Zixibacteria bacterium]